MEVLNVTKALYRKKDTIWACSFQIYFYNFNMYKMPIYDATSKIKYWSLGEMQSSEFTILLTELKSCYNLHICWICISFSSSLLSR